MFLLSTNTVTKALCSHSVQPSLYSHHSTRMQTPVYQQLIPNTFSTTRNWLLETHRSILILHHRMRIQPQMLPVRINMDVIRACALKLRVQGGFEARLGLDAAACEHGYGI